MYLDRKTLRRMAGEVIVCGFTGQQLDAALKEVDREVRPLGLIAFARNVTDASQATELNRELKAFRPDGLMAIDQEGGPVARLTKGVTLWPALAEIGARGDHAWTQSFGAGIAKEMRAIGYDINFAPVVDVHTNPANPIIGQRAFSADAGVCARLGAAFVRGHQQQGVGASAKHFPGHGDTSVDSHHALPHVAHSRRRLESIEWPPFAAAIDAKVSSIMTAHVCLDQLDDKLPATISADLLTGVLRQQMGFAGVIVADDVDMKGLSEVVSADHVGQRALSAGCDVLLACHDPAVTLSLYAGIVRAAESGTLPHATLSNRAVRAAAWRQRWLRPPLAKAEAKLALAGAREQNARLLAALRG